MLTQAEVHWIELDSVDSTNDFLARLYQQQQPNGVVAVVARAQTAGRGRAGREWKAIPDASLCLSVGLPFAGHRLPFMPLCVGVAVAEVLEQMGVPVRLKWPNDLLVEGRKIGGVLCESFQTPAGAVTVIGLGLNLEPVDVPGAVGGQGAASLSDWVPLSGRQSPRRLAEELLPAILRWIDLANSQGISSVFNEFSRRDAWLGQNVVVSDQGETLLAGKAMGIDQQGAYLVQTPQGLRAVHSGDLSLRVAS